MKQLIGTIFLISFIFSGVNFNQSTVFSSLDEVNGPIVGNAMGVDFDMNESMSIGYDSILGMLVKAKSPMGIEFRIGFSATDTATYGVDILGGMVEKELKHLYLQLLITLQLEIMQRKLLLELILTGDFR